MKKKKVAQFAGLLTSSVLTIHLINKLIFFFATLKEKLVSENDTFYDWKFGKIYYRKTGTGSPILLIHDLSPELSAQEWKKTIQYYSQNHTVYAIDLLGCGRSDKPAITYTNFLYVQLITDFIEDVIKDKVTVIASGLSCSFVIMACHINPDHYNNLIFINPLNPDTAKKKCNIQIYNKCIKYLFNVPIIGTMLYNMQFSKLQLDQKLNHYYFYRKGDYSVTRDLLYEAAHIGTGNNRFLYSSILSNYIQIDFSVALREINHNICIIGGEYVKNIEKNMLAYQELNPSIETYIIPDSKQLPHMENSNAFIEICKIFL